MARATGSYPVGHGFKSNSRYQQFQRASVGILRPVGQEAKTPPFHGGNRSSILLRVTTKSTCESECFFVIIFVLEELMEFQLNRMFNLLRPHVIVISAILIGIMISYLFSADTVSTILLFVCFLLWIFLCVRLYPKMFTAVKGSIYYTESVLEPRPKLSFVVIRPRSYVMVQFKISEINNIEYCQNFIEKRFNVGHIVFHGKTEIITPEKYINCTLKSDVHVIYGISDFQNLQNNLSLHT